MSYFLVADGRTTEPSKAFRFWPLGTESNKYDTLKRWPEFVNLCPCEDNIDAIYPKLVSPLKNNKTQGLIIS